MRSLVTAVTILVMASSLSAQNSAKYLELADSADYYINHELWDKAEASIQKALRLEPANFHNSMLLSNLGIVQINKDEFEKAIDSFTLGLAIAPSSSVLYNNRAQAYILLDKIPEAMTDLDSSLSLDSVQEWPLQTLALIYINDNNEVVAKEYLQKLKTHYPNNSVAFSGLATLATRAGNVEEALELYKISLELNPQDQETLCSYIFLLIETDRFTDARSFLREAIEKFPDNPMFYLLRGYLHRLNYRNDEALADKKTAIAKGLDPAEADRFIPK